MTGIHLRRSPAEIARPILAAIIVAGVTALLGSCGNCGATPFCFDFAKEHSKEKMAGYHRDMSLDAYEPVGYRGSDATHHHYLARPVDWFVNYHIPKSQLRLTDERPLLKGIDTHYRVSPKDNIWTAVDAGGKSVKSPVARANGMTR